MNDDRFMGRRQRRVRPAFDDDLFNFRFEEEIGLPIPEPGFQPPAATPRIIGTNTYNEAKKSLAGAGHSHFGESTAAPPLGALPPPPPPPPSVPFIPPQVRAMPP
ncbi:unnamed protein product, partial [Nesidiocoris tenuis]